MERRCATDSDAPSADEFTKKTPPENRRHDTKRGRDDGLQREEQEYYLHGRAAANGKTTLYFFSKEAKEGALDKLPDGYEVSENSATGLPILKKSK